MKITTLLIVVFALILSGCSAMNFDQAERWAEGDTLYSTKLPSLEVTVAPPLIIMSTRESNQARQTKDLNLRTSQNTQNFYFKNDDGSKNVRVRIYNFTPGGRVFLRERRFSEKDHVLRTTEQKINGEKYYVNIRPLKLKRKTILIKDFERIVDDTTGYTISYYEKVPSEWLSKSKLFLTSEDKDFLSAFNKRANDSFTVGYYSGHMRTNIIQ